MQHSIHLSRCLTLSAYRKYCTLYSNDYLYSYSYLDEEEGEHDGKGRLDLELRVVLNEVGHQAEQREEHHRAHQVHHVVRDLAPQHHRHGKARHDV